MGKKYFDFVIGNPPYQDETTGEQKNYSPQIYNLFMNEYYKVGKKVELIHPARFLFNAGGTPKAWNHKMLNDPHFKVLYYEQKSGNIFANTDIKGGIAVTYRDESQDFEPIGTFTIYEELNSIKNKVISDAGMSLRTIISNRGLYRFSKLIYKENPKEMERFSDSRISSSAFDRLPEEFFYDRPNDGKEYIEIFGRTSTGREYRWIRKDYVKDIENLYKFKVVLPKSNGTGALGEILSTPVVLNPMTGYTETFIGIGSFNNIAEANSLLKYIKTKFVRVLLGILKITQDNTSEKWEFVPLQDFTPNSDINWSKSIHEIDPQLYRKYGLDEKEINFIETHVKEME